MRQPQHRMNRRRASGTPLPVVRRYPSVALTVPLALVVQICGDIGGPDRLDTNVALPQIAQKPPREVRVLGNSVSAEGLFLQVLSQLG